MMPRSRALVDGGMGLESGSGGRGCQKIPAGQRRDLLDLAAHHQFGTAEVLAQATEQQLRVLDRDLVATQCLLPRPGLAGLAHVGMVEAAEGVAEGARLQIHLLRSDTGLAEGD